jgi:cell division control protein 6
MPSIDEDDLFTIQENETSSIFNNKELLKISKVVGPDRIVQREQEIQKVASALNEIVNGNSPDNILIYGKTGTGKSLVSKYVSREAKNKAREVGRDVDLVIVDCSQYDTETKVTRRIAQSLAENEDANIDIPESGIGASRYYDYIWNILDDSYDGVIVILDEIDMLNESDDLLMQFSRAGENEKTEANIGLICTSNKIDYKDSMGMRAQSSLQEREMTFDPYDANELREILENRKDAFEEGVLSNDVIPVSAALAAQEHGDARKAMRIFSRSGEVAEEEGSETVKEDHVKEAYDRIEIDRVKSLVSGMPVQGKLVLYSLVILDERNRESEFNTDNVMSGYRKLASKIDMKEISRTRVLQILKEWSLLGVTESERKGKGRGEGMASWHRLNKDNQMLKEVLQEDERISQKLD